MRATTVADEKPSPLPHRKARASPALPGSPEKLEELALRARLKQPLWVDGDAADGAVEKPAPPTGVGSHQFRRNLYRARVRACLSQSALASAAGLSRETVRLLEGGERDPTLTTLLKIAAALGLKVGELLGEVGAADIPLDKLRKRCTRCGRSKPLDAFPPDYDSPLGRLARCRKCERERTSRRNYPRKRLQGP